MMRLLTMFVQVLRAWRNGVKDQICKLESSAYLTAAGANQALDVAQPDSADVIAGLKEHRTVYDKDKNVIATKTVVAVSNHIRDFMKAMTKQVILPVF